MSQFGEYGHSLAQPGDGFGPVTLFIAPEQSIPAPEQSIPEQSV